MGPKNIVYYENEVKLGIFHLYEKLVESEGLIHNFHFKNGVDEKIIVYDFDADVSNVFKDIYHDIIIL